MAKTLSKSGISTGQDILAWHVTQSVDAFTGTGAYDVTLSGSLNVTGSVVTGSISNAHTASYITADNIVQPFTHITASGNISASTSVIAPDFKGSPEAGANRVAMSTDNRIDISPNNSVAVRLTNTLVTLNKDTVVQGTLATDGHITASGNISANNAVFSGSLVTTGSATLALPSGSSHQSFGVMGAYQTNWNVLAEVEFYRDDYISLIWDGGSDFEARILTDPSTSEVHITYNNEGTYSYLDRQVSDGQFIIDTDFTTDETGIATFRAPEDNNWPFYRVTVVQSTATYDPTRMYAIIEKLIN